MNSEAVVAALIECSIRAALLIAVTGAMLRLSASGTYKSN